MQITVTKFRSLARIAQLATFKHNNIELFLFDQTRQQVAQFVQANRNTYHTYITKKQREAVDYCVQLENAPAEIM